MSFRKRNVGLSRTGDVPIASSQEVTPPIVVPGVRPSPVDGRSTTSTGTLSLDGILAGHAGLALGSSLLLEESGTTDYAGTLLRYYAAEGIVQGHSVHVVGAGQQWGRDLPGVIGTAEDGGRSREKEKERDKMKIAWRYERLGEFGAAPGGGGVSRASAAAVERNQVTSSMSGSATPISTSEPPPFCHIFDLAKRLEMPAGVSINYIPISLSDPNSSPFVPVLQTLSKHLNQTPAATIHRLIIPTLLSPALYPPHASLPQHFIQFLHALRSLLRTHTTRLTAVLTLPLALHARSTSLVRWAELLSDGVLELAPFPHIIHEGPSLAISGAATAQEDAPQGMLKVHSLPVFHERGGGGAGGKDLGDDLAFVVSRRKFVIRPFSLPPAEGDTEAQKGGGEGKVSKADIEF